MKNNTWFWFTVSENDGKLNIRDIYDYMVDCWYGESEIDLMLEKIIPNALIKAIETGQRQIVNHKDNVYMYAYPDKYFTLAPDWILDNEGNMCAYFSRRYLKREV